MRNDIEAVFTDFGGVLIDLQFEHCFKRFKEMGVNTPQKILFNSDSFNKVMQQLEIGTIEPSQFYAELRKLLNITHTDKEVEDAWNLIIGEVPTCKIELLKELRKHYRLYMVSNTNAPHFDYARKKLFREEGRCVDDYFDKLYLSHEIHAQKPNEEFYRKVLDDSKEIAERSIFIDDFLENIIGAEKVGFKTLLINPLENVNKKIIELLV